MRRLFVLLLTLLFAGLAAAADAPLPGESVLRVPAQFTDQAGKTFTLAQRRGGANTR